ncbi:unnamed protein product [Rotaria sordida]|uniref:Helicase XPB/Ssl2 N-terminal domain-containing protein n=2 Tax=Rotaria sordida TaxID=392033 RepID=A0A818QU57_9BILA|nr:unnamed protein product [Rotaria sordida]CAF3646529.1 unnamed protein product [Rotaria sordida]
MNKRVSSKESNERVLKTTDCNRKDDVFELEKTFIPLAASRRLDDSVHDEDDDLDQSCRTKTTSGTLKDFRSDMELIVDHKNHPLWITPDGHIFFESFSSGYKQAHHFLITIAEPFCRPEYIQQYKLSAYSIYAVVSIGLQTNDIIEFIKLCTLSYGKVKLVLQHNRYIVESSFPNLLKNLLKDSQIQECRLITTENNIDINTIREKFRHLISERVLTKENTTTNKQISNDIRCLYEKIDRNDKDIEDLKIVSFEVNPNKIELLRK